ncbi:TLR4 interactor with leucine rich repeats [Eucyclogobius newberryi]|uniref:TLR4 interactor with leucine rich repeats n=1 Tax=Eucyclogobius newberryi TaxID=166745 RepID=UPI003B5CDF06
MDSGTAPVLVWVLLLLSTCSSSAFCPERCDCQHPIHIICTNRGLRHIPQDGSLNLEDVMVFSLGGNFITNISAHDLARYGNLKRLNLQYNQIRSIHPKAFENLSKLEELYLGHNNLSSIPSGTLQSLEKLTILYGNDNEIKRIPSELFANLDTLVKLRLDGNALQIVKDTDFKSLTNLHYLHLELNQLQHIHPHAFSWLSNLRFLNLSHNKQKALRNSHVFSQLKALTTLLLSDNEIQYVAKGIFQNLHKLSTLALSNNRISRLDSGALQGLSGLRELLIDGNKLEEIPAGTLNPLESIEELDLSRNSIAKVDSLAFSHLKNLKVLKLKNNFLTSLSGDSFTLNTRLYDLDLHGNNWTCDCRLEELQRWMTEAHSRGNPLSVLVQCHFPVTLRGTYLDYVNTSQLQSLSNWTHLCQGPKVPEESRAGEIVVKEAGEVAMITNVKPQAMEEVQGDQGGPNLEGTSEKNDAHLVRSQPVARSAGGRRKGKQKSKIIPRTDPPSITTSFHGINEVPPTNITEYELDGNFDLLRLDLPVITDPCVFNRNVILNVSVDQITSSSVRVHWSTKDYRCHTQRRDANHQEIHFRILFDRFGTTDKFPRYVYAHSTAKSITLKELSSDVTYMVCIEGVVGGSVCKVAPRDHCTGLVTSPENANAKPLTFDLYLVTVATLAVNALLLLIIGAVWLGRGLKRKLQKRKSAVHVRHMYSTRRQFRATNMAAAAVAADFSSYQSGGPARLSPLEDRDLIEFPCERFLDSATVRRASEMQRFTD